MSRFKLFDAMALIVAISFCLLSGSPLPVVAADGVYRMSNQQSFSKQLGVQTVPTCVVVNGVRHPGIYITTAPQTDLGRNMKLSPGMVLLTVDNYSMTSGSVADTWITHRVHNVMPFSYAMESRGKPAIFFGQVQQETASPSDIAINGPRHGPLPKGTFDKNGSGPVHPKLVPSMTDGELSDYAIALINESRKAAGLGPLTQNFSLANFAHGYADYMAKHRDDYELSSNRDPHQDLMGRWAPERARSAGLTDFIDENIGRSSRSLGDQVQLTNLHRQMMASAGHRENILNPEAKTVGIGIARGDNRLYVTEEFGH